MGVSKSAALSEKDMSDVMARMDRFRQSGQTAHEDKGNSGSGLIVMFSCALSALGIILFICTLCVICTPDSALAQIVMLVCEALF